MDDRSTIQYLNITMIQPNPLQPRGAISPDSIMDLVDSVAEHGILEPLVIAHTPAGYQIIAGERRWRAAKMAGLSEVPCVIKDTSPKQMLEMAIVENVQREDLNPLERAKAFSRLMQEFGMSNADVARRVSKSTAYVSNTMKLLELPDALKDGLLTGMITEGHARALLGVKDRMAMIEAYKMILRESASVRRAEEITRRIREQLERSGQQEATKQHPNTKFIHHEKIDEMQAQIKQTLGDRSKVKLLRTERQTKLLIVLNGTPEDTEQQLNKIYEGLVGEPKVS